jgi:hypothetical protein
VLKTRLSSLSHRPVRRTGGNPSPPPPPPPSSPSLPRHRHRARSGKAWSAPMAAGILPLHPLVRVVGTAYVLGAGAWHGHWVPQRRGFTRNTADGGARCSGPHIATAVGVDRPALGGGWWRGRPHGRQIRRLWRCGHDWWWSADPSSSIFLRHPSPASGVAGLVGFGPKMVPERVSLMGTVVAEWPPPFTGGGRPGPS